MPPGSPNWHTSPRVVSISFYHELTLSWNLVVMCNFFQNRMLQHIKTTVRTILQLILLVFLILCFILGLLSP